MRRTFRCRRSRRGCDRRSAQLASPPASSRRIPFSPNAASSSDDLHRGCDRCGCCTWHGRLLVSSRHWRRSNNQRMVSWSECERSLLLALLSVRSTPEFAVAEGQTGTAGRRAKAHGSVCSKGEVRHRPRYRGSARCSTSCDLEEAGRHADCPRLSIRRATFLRRRLCVPVSADPVRSELPGCQEGGGRTGAL